jgi:broad specificity phosphatase PhoE
MAKRIMIIRHGEKPKKGFLGLDVAGKEDSNSLIVHGWQRAGSLAEIFKGDMKPDHIFACYKSEHSQRAFDTVTPIADFLRIQINISIEKGEEKKMAIEAMKCKGTVLISWEHHSIHAIANEITSCSVPSIWPDDRFDNIYIFDKTGDGYSFKQRPQLVLNGDQNQPFSL